MKKDQPEKEISITYINGSRVEKYWIFDDKNDCIVFRCINCITCIDGYCVVQVASGKNKY